MLPRLVSWLAPGGWLVLEDATFVPEIASRPVVRRLLEAWMGSAAATGSSDLTWARTFPLPLDRAGLTDTSAEVSMPVLRGGSALAASMEAATRLTSPTLSVDVGELDELYALFADRSFVDCAFLVVVAWGRRPQTT